MMRWSWTICIWIFHTTYFISRVTDQNGVSLQYIMLEIHHSGREPSEFIFINLLPGQVTYNKNNNKTNFKKTQPISLLTIIHDLSSSETFSFATWTIWVSVLVFQGEKSRKATVLPMQTARLLYLSSTPTTQTFIWWGYSERIYHQPRPQSFTHNLQCVEMGKK